MKRGGLQRGFHCICDVKFIKLFLNLPVGVTAGKYKTDKLVVCVAETASRLPNSHFLSY